MKSVRGYTTLLLTTVVLLIILVVTMSTSRSMYQYLRIVEHRITTMQQDWEVEGAIECVFAKSRIGHLFPLDVKECTDGVDTLDVTGQVVRKIKATNGFSTLTRHFSLPSADSFGAIKTSANLVLTDKSTFAPDPGELNEDLDWECISVRYRHDLSASSITTLHPYELGLLPYQGFPESSVRQQRCTDSHHSVDRTISNAKSDFYHDSELNPFEDLFGVSESNWFDVFSNTAVGRVPHSLDSHNVLSVPSAEKLPIAQMNTHCASDIEARINQGKDLVWVYGGCELNESDVSQISDAIENQFTDSGIILVVHNGILAVESQQTFPGLVMQFTSPGSTFSTALDWASTQVNQDIIDFMAHSSNPDLIGPDQISYFQVGRFNPVGGLVLSSNNTYAVIKGQLHFQYQRDLIARPLAHIRPVGWVFGSWGDEYATSE
ncbi:hypothetical protein ACWU4D_15710 [Vibrio sp. WJH972]